MPVVVEEFAVGAVTLVVVDNFRDDAVPLPDVDVQLATKSTRKTPADRTELTIAGLAFESLRMPGLARHCKRD